MLGGLAVATGCGGQVLFFCFFSSFFFSSLDSFFYFDDDDGYVFDGGSEVCVACRYDDARRLEKERVFRR